MIKNKKCGNCIFFQKWRNTNCKDSALCEAKDCRTDSGNKACLQWSGIKYNRSKNKFKI